MTGDHFTIHHSPFTIHHSPFTIHHSPFAFYFLSITSTSSPTLTVPPTVSAIRF